MILLNSDISEIQFDCIILDCLKNQLPEKYIVKNVRSLWDDLTQCHYFHSMFSSQLERYILCVLLLRVTHFFNMEDFNVRLTLLTAELSAKTVYFFQSCGADMGISSSAVLNRLLLKISENTPDAAAKLTMWYFEALTARKSTQEKLEILHIFDVLCSALFDDDTVMKYVLRNSTEDTTENNDTPVDFTFSRTITVAITNDTATLLKQKMSEYKLSEGETIDIIINDFTSQDSKTIPYTLINYLFISAHNLTNPQAHMAICLAASYSTDRIFELSGCNKESVIDRIMAMCNFAYTEQDVLDNINFIKESRFYKEKFGNNEIL